MTFQLLVCNILSEEDSKALDMESFQIQLCWRIKHQKKENGQFCTKDYKDIDEKESLLLIKIFI